MSVRFWFQFFRQEISYTSPINLGAAMLNYCVKAGEAGDDSERSGSYMTPWSGHGDRTARPPRPLPHAIRIIKSAYSAPFATAQLSCFELAAVRCLRQYSRESKSKKYQPKNWFRFNSIFKKKFDFDLRFDNRNITNIYSHTRRLQWRDAGGRHASIYWSDGSDVWSADAFT